MEAMDLMLATIFTDEEAADVNFYATDDVFELVEAPPERSDSDETAAGVDRYGVDDVCELAKAPSERSISRPELLSKSNEPVKKNLAALNCLDEFREWLEENGDAWALETVFDVSDGVESFRRRRWYNLPKLSNLTIRSGPWEIKCHKVLLATRSAYFRTAFKEISGFKESQQGFLTLEEDQPGAVEAVVRHVYGFRYEEIVEGARGGRVTPWVHLANYEAADKYLLPELTASAVDGPERGLWMVDTDESAEEADRYAVEEAFELVKALRGRGNEFRHIGGRLMEQHLAALHGESGCAWACQWCYCKGGCGSGSGATPSR